jgi:hypothetical protein
MKATKIIERLCCLASKVGDQAFNAQEAHDCFCPHFTDEDSCHLPGGGFQFSEKVLAFIEEAVNEKLEGGK